MTKRNHKKGFTIVELVIVIAVIMILVTASVVLIDPVAKKKRARDNKRLSDVSTIDRAINEYLLDKGDYPDQADTLRESTTLPLGSSALVNAVGGWIAADLSKYTSRLPIDPLNDGTYHYSYYHTVSSYELDAPLEYLTEEAQNDGGDDPQVYEMGNDLTLISP
jgi:prepilin-type N-terminal cleavage/methylation domain-containing protein